MTSQYFRSRLSSLREYLTPINNNSTFLKNGEISPAEFVKAGDYLVYKFPTWQWSPALDPSKEKDFLPKDKQFLITKHVPCYVRASEFEVRDNGDGNGDIVDVYDDQLDNEGWSSTNVKVAQVTKPVDEASIKEISDEDESDVQDIDDLIDENAEDFEFTNTKPKRAISSNNKRYYDLYITYSTSYRVPKMYLVGYDSDNILLKPKEMFDDISVDYRDKTVTIENFPYVNHLMAVSIHPCKHANVMRVLMNRKGASREDDAKREKNEEGKEGHDDDEEDDWEDVDNGDSYGVRVDQYLIVFLKFISSVIPGIEHDYTMDAL